MTELQYEDTRDIQHDLAMALADGERYISGADLAAELRKRGAAMPVNCRWEHCVYSRFGKKLVYDLEVTP